MAELCVVQSKVREMVGGMDMNVGGDFLDEMDKVVQMKTKKAVDRAKANGRKTVRACDL